VLYTNNPTKYAGYFRRINETQTHKMAAHEKKLRWQGKRSLFDLNGRFFHLMGIGLKRRGHDKQSFVSVYTVFFFMVGEGGSKIIILCVNAFSSVIYYISTTN